MRVETAIAKYTLTDSMWAGVPEAALNILGISKRVGVFKGGEISKGGIVWV